MLSLSSFRISIRFVVLGALGLGFALLPGISHAQQSAPDNTKRNQGDGSQGATTDQPRINPVDSNITKQIRRAIIQDKSLSSYAHNIKVIAQDGKVTLKGPDRSEDEKASIESEAAAVAGPLECYGRTKRSSTETVPVSLRRNCN